MRSGWLAVVTCGIAVGCGHPQAVPDRASPSPDPIAVTPPDAAPVVAVDAPMIAVAPVDASQEPATVIDAPVPLGDPLAEVETEPLPPGRWHKPCAEIFRTAQATLAASYPEFKRGKVTTLLKPPRVRFTANVNDPIHKRFFSKPATFTAEVIQRPSDEPGYLMPSVSGPDGDEQTSVSLARWTTTRTATLEVQIVRKAIADEFTKAFDPAIRACLR